MTSVRRGFRLIGCCLAAVIAAAASRADTLTFVTHPLAPFTTGTFTEPRGLAVDIVNALRERTGDEARIELTSFARVLTAVQRGSHVVGFVIARTPEREATMQWVGPLIVGGVYVYKRAGSPVRIATLEDLRAVDVIAVQLGNADDQYLTRLGFTNLTRNYQQVETLSVLRHGRVSAAPMSELVFPSLVAEAGLRRSDFERTDVKLYDSALYLGFAKDVPARVIETWSAALAELKASGRYDEIVNAYQLTD